MKKKGNKIYEANIVSDSDDVLKIAKALDSEIRIRIIKELLRKNYTINHLARILKMSLSALSFHISLLHQSGIISITQNSHKRGNEKLLSVTPSFIGFDFKDEDVAKPRKTITKQFTIPVPIGSYSSCEVTPPCGIYIRGEKRFLTDEPISFYASNRFDAYLLWFASGYVEYKLPFLSEYRDIEGVHQTFDKNSLASITIFLELCSECPAYDNQYESEICFYLNEKKIATYISPGDFGGRQGKESGNSDYKLELTSFGNAVKICIDKTGTYVNGQKNSSVNVDYFNFKSTDLLTFKIESSKDSNYCGGINLFGKGFGDYGKDIEFVISYFVDE